MKERFKLLFLHGFTASGQCVMAKTLAQETAAFADVLAPDIPLHPYAAMKMLRWVCETEQPDLIVGSSCGSFYGQQLVGLTRTRAVLVSPFLRMSEFLESRLGKLEYKSPRLDGIQQVEITPELVNEFASMQSTQFEHYEAADHDKAWGMFGSNDTIAHFRDLFERYYTTTIDYDGPHTMTAENVRVDLVPIVSAVLRRIQASHRHRE